MMKILFRLANGDETEVESRGGFTLMEAAVAAGIEGIASECGGGCSCGTCHLHIEAPAFDKLNAPTGFESEMLEIVQNRAPNSRLACQVTLSDDLSPMVVFIPSPNAPL